MLKRPILCPPNENSQLIGKDPNAGKNWRLEENGMTEDKMVGWHLQLNGHEREDTLGNSEGQEARHAAVHGAAKSWTWLRDWKTTTKRLWISNLQSKKWSELQTYISMSLNLWAWMIFPMRKEKNEKMSLKMQGSSNVNGQVEKDELKGGRGDSCRVITNRRG